MSMTTIRIDDELKARVALAAQRAGKTSHGFILEAICRTVEDAELEDGFHKIADERWQKVQATGKAIAAEEMHAYLVARAQGKPATLARARKVAR